MGHFVEGTWVSGWYKSKAGKFQRPATTFREKTLSKTGDYHLYVSLACPWAHRTLITRKLRNLDDFLPVTVVHWYLTDDGWEFQEPEPLYGCKLLRELYVKADPRYTGRVTVPVLWDKQRQTIVNNESREVMRLLNTQLAETGPDLAPRTLREQIDQVIDQIYEPINNGVYRCGFATTQEAYDQAVNELFAALDHWEQRLKDQRYLLGDQLTEADICMFTTLIRFDPVYSVHFKCSKKRIRDYPNLSRYLNELYNQFQDTVDFDHIRNHYYQSHDMINPTRIVAAMPA